MKDKIYTKKEAKDLIRKEQEYILNNRKVSFFYKDKEDVLIQKILLSNPVKEKLVVKEKPIDVRKSCYRCSGKMNPVIGEIKIFECEKCKARLRVRG